MSEPYYYADEHITLYHGDNLAESAWLSADVLVTDPPYGMSHSSGWKKRPIAGDDTTKSRDKVLAYWGDRPALVFGRWNIQHPETARLMLTWNKGDWPGMGDLKLPWGPSTEEIYVLGKGFVVPPGGKRAGSTLYANRIVGKKATHPNEKPLALMAQLLDACPPEWTIADPFAGSGATLHAAKLAGRRAIGVELDEAYCELIATRLSTIPQQEGLFS